MKSEKYGERRGAAFGLAGVVKGFGIPCLKKYNIVAVLREGLADRFVLHDWFKQAFVWPTNSNRMMNLLKIPYHFDMKAY